MATIFINEEQKRFILMESIDNELKNTTKESEKLINRIQKEASKQINFDLSIMLTFSASIAGFIGPVEDFIKDKHHELTSMEISLILTGVIFQFMKDNSEVLPRVLKKIKENGLTSIYKETLSKANELKNSFLNFILSLGITLQKSSNVLGYTFLIPIIPILYNSISEGIITTDNVEELIKRFTYFGLINYGGFTLKEVLTHLIKKIKG